MPRAEVGTPKYLANAMKSKGLQRLRWYCQVCQKQCRDENGFKCHAQSEAHLRQMLVVGEHAGRQISDFSSQFQSEFVSLLSRRFGTKRVHANRVYQEFIQDKHHLHMNATRWVTLTEFCKHLGRLGIARVDETEKGWFIAWIDSSPKALAKQEASMKKERATMSDEARERLLIAEQIDRAAADTERTPSGDEDDKPAVEEGLKREEGTKLVLPVSIKPAAPAASATTSISLTAKVNPLKAKAPVANPLKRTNVFKTGSTKTSPPRDDDTEKVNGKKRNAPMSAAERLILEEQERKKRKLERDGGH